MQEIHSKFHNILESLNKKYGFNIESSENYTLDLSFEIKSLPENPGKRDGDQEGLGNSKLYWDSKSKTWLPTDYFNATRSKIEDIKFEKMTFQEKNFILAKLKKIEKLDLKEFPKNLIDEFKKLYEEKEDKKKEEIKNKIIGLFDLFSRSTKNDVDKINEILKEFQKMKGSNESKKLKRLIIRLDDPVELIKEFIKKSPVEEYTPEKKSDKKDLTIDDLDYLRNIIFKQPNISRAEFFKKIKTYFNDTLIREMELAWEMKGDSKKPEAVNFSNNFIDKYDDSDFRDSLKRTVNVVNEIKENKSETKREMSDLSPILKPFKDFLNDAKKAIDAKEYENSFLGFTERFFNAIEDYSKSGQQFAEIDNLIATILTGVNLNSKEGLTKVWSKAKIPNISKKFEDLGEKLHSVLNFKELAIKIPKKDDVEVKTRAEFERQNVTFKELNNIVVKRLEDIKNPPPFVKEFKYLVNNVPEFVYKEKDEASNSKKRELNPKDVEISETIMDSIQKKELTRTMPGKDIEEIRLQREEYKKKKEELDRNNLMNILPEKSFDDIAEILDAIEDKDNKLTTIEKKVNSLRYEIQEKRNQINKKYKDDDYETLLTKKETLEKNIEKETNPDSLKIKRQELSDIKQKLDKITEEKKNKSEEIKKEIDQLTEDLKDINSNLDDAKKEKKDLENKKKDLDKDLKEYDNVSSFWKGLRDQYAKAEKYKRSITYQRKLLEEEKTNLEQEINELKKNNLKKHNDDLINRQKEHLDFLKKAIDHLSYFLTSDRDVINLSESKQKEYLANNLKAIQKHTLEIAPNLIFEWKLDPKIDKDITELRSQIDDLEKSEKDLTEKDRVKIKKLQDKIEHLKITGRKKEKVPLEEARQRLEEVRKYFLTPQDIKGKKRTPKMGLMTQENFLEYVKGLDDQFKKMKEISEEGVLRFNLRYFFDAPISSIIENTDNSQLTLPSYLKSKKDDIVKIRGTYENYLKLFDIDKKNVTFFDDLENVGKKFKNLIDKLEKRKLFELSEEQKNLDLEEKEKIFKEKKEEFINQITEANNDLNKIKKDKSLDGSFKKFIKLRDRANDIDSYIKTYNMNQFQESKIDYDYLSKKLEEILDKKFKNKEELEKFLDEENFLYKDKSKNKLEEFINKLNGDINTHKKLLTESIRKSPNNKTFDERELFKNLNPSFGIKAGSILLKTENSILYKIDKISGMIQDPFIKLEIKSIRDKLKMFI